MTPQLRTTPFPYQVECDNEVEDFNGRALVALPPGLGKTLTSLLHLHRHPEIGTTIVICPAYLKWLWENEIRKHLGMRSEVLSSRTVKKIKHQAKILIVNYDILKDWLEYLLSLKPGLLILDECHYLATPRSQRSKAAKILSQDVPRILALSGTPIVNNPIELWVTLNILRPDKWKNYQNFALSYCNPKLQRGRWVFKGATRAKRLHARLMRHVMVRRRKEDVLKDLPPKLRTVVPLDIPPAARKEYNHAVRDFLGWLKEQSPQKAARAAKHEDMVKVGYLLRMVAMSKLPSVFEWIDNFLLEEDKLLVFAIHNKILNALEDRYRGMCVRVDGSVIGHTRHKAFEQFNKVKKTRLLFANIDAGGTGWSCTSTSCTATVEMPWASGKLEQAEDRPHGVGRGVAGRRVQSFIFVAKNTIEEKLCEILQRKSTDISKVLDGKQMGNEVNLYDELLKELEHQKGVRQ